MAAESTGMIEQSNQYNSVMPGLLGLAGTAIQAGVNWGINQENIKASKDLAEADRLANFQYGEQAADAADKRTRKLYEDYYSPQALVEQYRAAGMSPGLLMGGTPGQGGHAGSQGSGAAGVQTSFVPYAPVSMLEAAQAAALMAQTEKTKAETKNIGQDTKLKELETKLQELHVWENDIEWNILNSQWTNPENGEATSLFEMAKQYYNYESFLEDIRKNKDKVDLTLYNESQTETGQKILRSIYENANRFDRDLSILTNEKVSAEFHIQITEALQKSGFAELNKDAAIAQLKQSISTNELTNTQKEAWNNLIDQLGKKGSTTKDIIVVLGMILGNFASHTGIKIQM